MTNPDDATRGLDTLAAVGEIAARVAHEINNALAGIHYSFLLIKDAVPADHPQYSSIAAIEREIKRIAGVTRQMYETYRPERDTQPDASLTAIVGDAAVFLEQSNQASRVRVTADISAAPGVVQLSAALLRLVVYNLAQQAIDASVPGGNVAIVARVENGALEVRATPNEVRADAKKTGVGLSLVRQMVTAAGGTISVNTTASGGVEFIAAIPLDTTEARP